MSDASNVRTYSAWLAGLFVLLALVFSLGGCAYYQTTVRSIRAGKYRELKAIADLKTAQIAAWRKERLIDAYINSAGVMRTAWLRWLQNSAEVSARKAVADHFRRMKEIGVYLDVMLAAPDGRVLLTPDSATQKLEPEEKVLINTAFAAREPAFGDLFYLAGQVCLDAAAPLFDDAGRPAAVLLVALLSIVVLPNGAKH